MLSETVKIREEMIRSWMCEGRTITGNEDGYDETVNLKDVFVGLRIQCIGGTYCNDTSHDDWDDTLHHQVWPEDGHGGNANTRFGRSITTQESASCQFSAFMIEFEAS